MVTIESIICKHCHAVVESTEAKEYGSEHYCVSCFDMLFFYCDSCEDYYDREDRYSVRGNSYCQDCYNELYFYCERCDTDCSVDDYGQDNMCALCLNGESSNTDVYRDYDTSNKYVSRGKRAYAIELECYHNQEGSMSNISHSLNEDIGIAHDGSLGNNGKEFITPKLSGKKGEKLLRHLCHELTTNSFTVDKTCGLHVHIDTSDFKNYEKIKNLFLFYLAYEPVIYSYLPYSRRKNRYCLPLSQFYHEQEIRNCNNKEDIEKIWYREQTQESIESRKKYRYDHTRYAGTNFHSMLSNGHIEIRHHSGTVDYNKIKKWIDLHVMILDKMSNLSHTWAIPETLSDIKHCTTLKEKQDKMFDFLDLPKNMRNYFTSREKKFNIKQKIQCVD